jgi:predicted nucleotide-binding protein
VVEIELPSDVAGILYIPFDVGRAWMFQLAAELAAAGIQIDLNRLAGV